MKLIRERAGLVASAAAARSGGRSLGLVPTMGALHAGHVSLLEAARRDCDTVAATIFVNPLQFGESEDFAAYPRDEERDSQVAAAAGVDILFVPTIDEMYPGGSPLTSVSVSRISTALEGASRPGHFDGVATVVTKLLSLAGPCRAYFGEKDFQQLVLVRRMVADLSLQADIVGCPIVREPSGLALSSRNKRLSPEQLEQATALFRALEAGRRAIEQEASRVADDVEQTMQKVLSAAEGVEPDYATVVQATTLERRPELSGDLRLLVAARVGPVRLIDNCTARA